MHSQYTYKISRADNHQLSEDRLNKLGKEGWKLTAILKAEDEPGTYLYYFVKEVFLPQESIKH